MSPAKKIKSTPRTKTRTLSDGSKERTFEDGTLERTLLNGTTIRVTAEDIAESKKEREKGERHMIGKYTPAEIQEFRQEVIDLKRNLDLKADKISKKGEAQRRKLSGKTTEYIDFENGGTSVDVLAFEIQQLESERSVMYSRLSALQNRLKPYDDAAVRMIEESNIDHITANTPKAREGEDARHPAHTRGKSATAEIMTCGCLTVFGDFENVLCQKKSYDLHDAKQAREMLRFLCDEKAIGESKGQSKASIHEHISKTCTTEANDWRPSHVFRNELASLYDAAVGRNRKRGTYWLNP